MNHDRLASSIDIDLLSAYEIVRIIQHEYRTVAEATDDDGRMEGRAIDEIAERLRHGGRLVYAGAGMGGRIAVLDAADLPATFGLRPIDVQTIVPCRLDAFFTNHDPVTEGHEDHFAISEVNERVRAEDAVLAVSASGRTPFTLGAVRRANMLGALTVGVIGRHGSPLTSEVDIPIVADVGNDLLVGTGRVKTATAIQMVLSTVSTGAMIRLGRVYSNLAVERPSVDGDRDTAIRIVELASGADRLDAASAFERADGDVKVAIVSARTGLDADKARDALESAGGNLRATLDPSRHVE